MLKYNSNLEDRLIDFAVRIIRTSEYLPRTKIGQHIGGQLIRSGTSPAPNYGEAQDAELRETKVWLQMVVKASLINPASKLDSLVSEADQLVSIFVRSIKTAKQNNRKCK